MENTVNTAAGTENKVEAKASRVTTTEKGNNMKTVNNTAAELDFDDLMSDLDVEEQAQESFIKHVITAKVTGFRITQNKEGENKKVQIQTKYFDEADNLVDRTFTLTSAKLIAEDEVKKLMGKFVQVRAIRYTKINRDFKNQEKNRKYTFGGKYEDLKVVESQELNFDLQSYVVMTLSRVADVIDKKTKKPNGQVYLHTLGEDQDQRSFTVKVKSDKASVNKGMFTNFLKKDVKILITKEYKTDDGMQYETSKSIKIATESDL